MKTEPKYLQIYRSIKEEIRCGALTAHSRLPSKRELAARRGVSVITVEAAYRMLVDEGYARAVEKSGYYVEEIGHFRPAESKDRPPLRYLSETRKNSAETPFFPSSAWFATVRKVLSEYGDRLLERSPRKGCAALRNAIAAYLLRYRSIYAQPEQIVIGSGSEQLYETVVRMFGAGRTYAIEDPSYAQIEVVYRGYGAAVEKLPVRSGGIPASALQHCRADILHVTPFHSYPSGFSASARARAAYLAWAAQGGRYLVEDDFDSEFFVPGNPPETLYSQDEKKKVIYLNTFSQSLSPSIRMGYMILPQALLPLYDEKLGSYSCSVPPLEQYTLAEFLNSGQFERHLNRKRKRMSQRDAQNMV